LDAAYQGQGRDEPERIKLAIADFVGNSNVRYVMLVGDSDTFPVRYTMTDRGHGPRPDGTAYPPAYNRAFYPTDLYYADLYEADASTFETWDANADGLYGELRGETIAGTLNVDQVDMDPDVAVSRVPASTVAEVAAYVDKVISFELSAYQSQWLNDIVLTADADWFNGASCTKKNDIATAYLSAFTIHRLYPAAAPCSAPAQPNPRTSTPCSTPALDSPTI